jgi:ubiquinone/menaquinone biosynthesis C-methylase UbiE
MGQRLVQVMPLAEAASVLDIGTGVGALIPDTRAAAPAADVIGVDPALGMLRVAQASVDAPLLAMGAQRFVFRAECLDAAVLAFMLFHLADPVQGLLEVARVLRPGGVVGVATWGEAPSFPASAVWDEALETFGAGQDSAAATDQNDLMDTPAKLERLLAQAGFDTIRTWAERFEHHWNLETLVAQRTGLGSYHRRLETLDAPTRARCLAQITARLAEIEAEGFGYRPEIVFAIGHRP